MSKGGPGACYPSSGAVRKFLQEDAVRKIMQEYFSYRPRQFAFNYTFHVSYAGDIDTMELIAHDTDNDIYHSTSISYEVVYASSDFGDVYGRALQALEESILEHEAYYLRSA